MSRQSAAAATRADEVLGLLRMLVSMLVFVHGLARVLGGSVPAFGEFLADAGLPAGLAIAWFVTVFELAGAPLLALGIARLVAPLCLVFVLIYTAGLWLVHWPAGWFVVGAGRNGMEYSVLLIGVMLANAWRWWPDFVQRRRR